MITLLKVIRFLYYAIKPAEQNGRKKKLFGNKQLLCVLLTIRHILLTLHSTTNLTKFTKRRVRIHTNKKQQQNKQHIAFYHKKKKSI